MKIVSRRGWIITGLGLAALLGLGLVLTQLQQPQHFADVMDMKPSGVSLRTVTVYYVASDTLLVVPRERAIVDRGSRKSVVEELILFLSESGADHRAPLPPGTRLNHVFENGEGELVLDFSGPLDAVSGGSVLEDRLRLTALARTLAENVEGLERLRILVHGRPLTHWGRHIHLEPVLIMETWL